MSISLLIRCVLFVHFVQNICCGGSRCVDSNILENEDELIFAHTVGDFKLKFKLNNTKFCTLKVV